MINANKVQIEIHELNTALDQYQKLTDEEMMAIGGGRLETIANEANGYLYYNTCTHKYGYQVTKDIFSATVGVIANGWAQAAGGGWL